LTGAGRSRHSRAFLLIRPSAPMSQQHRTAAKQARRKRYAKRKKAATQVARAARASTKK